VRTGKGYTSTNMRKKPLFASKTAIYLSKRLTGSTNKEVGKAFGVTYSAVSKSAQDMERILKEKREVRRDVESLISHFKVRPCLYSYWLLSNELMPEGK